MGDDNNSSQNNLEPDEGMTVEPEELDHPETCPMTHVISEDVVLRGNLPIRGAFPLPDDESQEPDYEPIEVPVNFQIEHNCCIEKKL